MPAPEPAHALGAHLFADRLLTVEAAVAIEVRHNIRSAVLVAILEHDGEPYTVLTRRPETLSRHAGEISFPGGREEAEDADLSQTALREAREEVGLDPTLATIVGALPPVPTIATGFAIYPFIAVLSDTPAWDPNPGEVAELIELPLTAIREGYARRRLTRRNLPIRTDTYVVEDHLIWGATARILGDLFDRIDLPA